MQLVENAKPTLEDFLAAYRKELISLYPWAQENPFRLKELLSMVHTTITTGQKVWDIKGPAGESAWRSLNLAGQVSYKKLRELPREASNEQEVPHNGSFY